MTDGEEIMAENRPQMFPRIAPIKPERDDWEKLDHWEQIDAEKVLDLLLAPEVCSVRTQAYLRRHWSA